IVTTLNAFRDGANEIGAQKFAEERGLQLHNFHSLDERISAAKRNRSKAHQANRPHLTLREQKYLWDRPPCSTEHNPGIISLCLGMPVMIKNNVAVECGVTNGAEALVVGWKANEHVLEDYKFSVLDVVFVRLKNPVKSIQLGGLPENVVPIYRRKVTIKCMLQNDNEMPISRTQVPLVLNFAMTDFNSQGRTRPQNPLELSECRTFQSIYTCLSRSPSLAGTLILSGLDTKKIRRLIQGKV
ncbi:hypothetical protein SISSUDRAFT_965308, partial [Sistotremastrum suecicum HHB10207 ss-3]